MVEERKTKSLLRRLKPYKLSDFPLGNTERLARRKLGFRFSIFCSFRFLVHAHLADSLARLASSPGVEVSDFPLGKIVSFRRNPMRIF
jgi:hypothetical protein